MLNHFSGLVEACWCYVWGMCGACLAHVYCIFTPHGPVPFHRARHFIADWKHNQKIILVLQSPCASLQPRRWSSRCLCDLRSMCVRCELDLSSMRVRLSTFHPRPELPHRPTGVLVGILTPGLRLPPKIHTENPQRISARRAR